MKLKNRLEISLFIILIFVFAFPRPNLARVFKPYDDFSDKLDYIDGQPGQEVTFGTKWIRFVPEKNRLSMEVTDDMLWFKVNAAGGRDPGFKLAFGWEEGDIAGIQFTIKVAELSKAGGWFGILCTSEEPNWLSGNWVFGVSPSHQHDWGPKGYFGSGSVGKFGGWVGFAYEDIPENTNMLRTIRAEWNSATRQMAMTVDPGKNTEWKKDDVPSNADLGKFPWWSIYITCDQVVKVAIDDVSISSESFPFSVQSQGKLATVWGFLKAKSSNSDEGR